MARHSGGGRMAGDPNARRIARESYRPDYRGCPRTRLLSADPPWLFGDSVQGSRGAIHKYGCLSVRDICRYPLPPLYDDGLLLLWRVAAMQEEALRVVWSWGFTVKAEMPWVKLSRNTEAPPLGQLPVNVPAELALDDEEDRPPDAKLHYGLGHYNRAAHETCLIATRGRFKADDASLRSVFFAPIGEHSEKPPEFYEYAEQMCEGPRVELFARARRRGWRCYGNELP